MTLDEPAAANVHSSGKRVGIRPVSRGRTGASIHLSSIEMSPPENGARYKSEALQSRSSELQSARHPAVRLAVQFAPNWLRIWYSSTPPNPRLANPDVRPT